MKNPRAYVMPFLIVQTLTAAISNKQFTLMKTSDTKQYYQMVSSQKLAAISQKFAAMISDVSARFSDLTRQANENALQSTNFNEASENNVATMEKLTNDMQTINAEKAAISSQQDAEESAVKAEALAKENPLDMLIKMIEPQIKAMSADRDGWQKVLDDATKGGS